MKPIGSNDKVAIIGLGYVGLPLAVEFGAIRTTVGFDIKQVRIEELRDGKDRTGEASAADLQRAKYLSFTSSKEDLSECRVFIITVPTPINYHKQPDISALLAASRMVGGLLKKGDCVIYESTVYPGCTEEDCVPVLEENSGLKFNVDFYCGYSPERINPGDKVHGLTSITKLTSGSTPEAADAIDQFYRSIIVAGTHQAESIQVAEAAKVIENVQRDVNIALVNELAMIFTKLGIDTKNVLDAASTKWNFLPFQPGLVGGHCIGVDPYYLTQRAEAAGFHPQLVLAGRRINDGMAHFVASELIKEFVRRRFLGGEGATRVLVLGLSFKENCPDVRNTKVIDLIHELEEFDIQVDVVDPWVLESEAMHEFGRTLVTAPQVGHYHGVILAVAHSDFLSNTFGPLRQLLVDNGVLYDVKNVLEDSDLSL